MIEEIDRVLQVLNGKLFGKYRGRVTDNADTENRGRLEVEVRSAMGGQKIWALPCFPAAGPDGRGFFCVPPVDSLVWVEFEAGNINYPIWSGCFWEKDALDAADARPNVKFWRTDSFLIRIDDEAGELVIEKTDGGRIVITGSDVTAEANSVVQQSGGKKTTLSQVSFNVFDGALEVV